MSCSDSTELKQFFFLQAFKEFSYLHKDQEVYTIDMNGYIGDYEFNGKKILGSAISMDIVAHQFGCNLSGVVYEQNRSNYKQLCQALRKFNVTKIEPINGDNLTIRHLVLPKQKGMFLYYDPNSVERPQVRALTSFAETYPNADILLYVGARELKRAHAHYGWPKPFEILDPLIATRSKAYVSDTCSARRQWFMLLLTNTEYNLPRYCDLGGPLGKLLRVQLNNTKVELEELCQGT